MVMASQTCLLLLVTILALTESTSQCRHHKNTMNVIDSCRRRVATWANNRQALANCSIGHGKYPTGGKRGAIYVVTDLSDDPKNPKQGTLRHGVIQSKPLWIVFARDMVITLKNELMINSYKTIDGRGAKVDIAYGPCITITHAHHVIVHGISIHDCKPQKSGIFHVQHGDDDAISIYHSHNIWIDHCYFTRASNGVVIDAIHGASRITISNNYFTKLHKASIHLHAKEPLRPQLWSMLHDHHDHSTAGENKRVTVVFNLFAPVGLSKKVPSLGPGYAHVGNNNYGGWGMVFSIEKSCDSTFFSEGNYFVAPYNHRPKNVKLYLWSGRYGCETCFPNYSKKETFHRVNDCSIVPALVASAGPLNCSLTDKNAC